MKINFVGNFANGYVGETGDANHLTREMENLGHKVRQVPQDIWKAHCDGEYDVKWNHKMPQEHVDINIICKWHHFTDEKYINKLHVQTNAPVFYWVWDYMNDGGIPQWHRDMVNAADLYLGNDVRNEIYKNMKNVYYFPFDVADNEIPRHQIFGKKYDVVFFGSWIGQGDRQVWLKEINRTNPIKAFSWNYQDWPKEFDVSPAVYGSEFARAVAESKIILGFSVDPTTWGYWSNRVGKVLTLGGFLLYQYAPGMELFLKDGAEYFSSIEEAREKIDHYLIDDFGRLDIAKRGFKIGQSHFTSEARVKELMILTERFLKKGDTEWKI